MLGVYLSYLFLRHASGRDGSGARLYGTLLPRLEPAAAKLDQDILDCNHCSRVSEHAAVCVPLDDVVWVCSAGGQEQGEIEALNCKVAKVRVEETVGVNERPLFDRAEHRPTPTCSMMT